MMFAVGVVALAAAAATMVPPGPGASANEATQPPPAREAKPRPPAPQPGMMVSHSSSPGPVTVRMSMPPPPIVAIPRIPGPADMMVPTGKDGEVRTFRSFSSNEACDEALAVTRRTISNVFCVSTSPPPPPPEHGYLIEVDRAQNDIVDLQTHPSMAACKAALASRRLQPGRQAICTPKLH